VFADGWTVRRIGCSGHQTIGVRRAALEYHTLAATTVNALFKPPVKGSWTCREDSGGASELRSRVPGLGALALRYGQPRPRPTTPQGGR